MNAKEELFERLRQHAIETRSVSISWNASDGGPRMDVEIKAYGGGILTSWVDDMILGDIGGPTGSYIIIGIVQNVFGSRARLVHRGNFYLEFVIV